MYHRISLLSRLLIEIIEAILFDLAERRGWAVDTNNPNCTRLIIARDKHVDVPIYSIPDDEFRRIAQDRFLLAKDAASFSEYYLSERLDDDWSAMPPRVRLAHKILGWLGECDRKHIEPLSRYLRIGINEYGTSIPVVSELLIDVSCDIAPSNIPQDVCCPIKAIHYLRIGVVAVNECKLLGSVEAFRGGIDDIHRRMGGQLEIALFDKTVSNPEARIHLAVERFAATAPDVRLSVHVDSINGIERGLLDGAYHVGVIPTHRHSKALSFTDLFGETMLMYCGARHPLFKVANETLSWTKIRKLPFAGLGYHSPNMVLSHRARLERAATGYDQEAIATLVLSGAYLGFLPDHYADSFAKAGQLRAVCPQRFRYTCRFASVIRRSPAPSRVVRAFVECLTAAHGLQHSG